MLSYPVTIIGTGGIGSWTAEQVFRLGCPRLMFYDEDTVAVHNLGNQNYVWRELPPPGSR